MIDRALPFLSRAHLRDTFRGRTSTEPPQAASVGTSAAIASAPARGGVGTPHNGPKDTGLHRLFVILDLTGSDDRVSWVTIMGPTYIFT